jgi:hypothetical protein
MKTEFLSETRATAGEIMPASVILTHETGFHNFQKKSHQLNENGEVIYPQNQCLESNSIGYTYPSSDDSDTKNILNNTLLKNQLDE